VVKTATERTSVVSKKAAKALFFVVTDKILWVKLPSMVINVSRGDGDMFIQSEEISWIPT